MFMFLSFFFFFYPNKEAARTASSIFRKEIKQPPQSFQDLLAVSDEHLLLINPNHDFTVFISVMENSQSASFRLCFPDSIIAVFTVYHYRLQETVLP